MSAFITQKKYDRQFSLASKIVCFGPYKVLLIGDATVGKTSILTRLMENTFVPDAYQATIGIDYKRKIIRLSETVGVNLHVWDTAGQERFRSLSKNYYRLADAVLLIFDVTDPKSFVDLPYWLEELSNFSHSERGVFQILIGNKVDLAQNRNVTRKCGQALGDKYNLDYIEVSARTGENVELVFTLIARALYNANQQLPEAEDGLKRGDAADGNAKGRLGDPSSSKDGAPDTRRPPFTLNKKPRPKEGCC